MAKRAQRKLARESGELPQEFDADGMPILTDESTGDPAESTDESTGDSKDEPITTHE